MRTDLLKQLLAVQTHHGDEYRVICFLINYARVESHGIKAHVDDFGNVYFVKGIPEDGGFYPCVCAHTDSVHHILPHPVVIKEHNSLLFAIDSHNQPTGCGGDDKAGIFICLELFEKLSVLKGVFFVSEEIFCAGSRHSDPEFFSDVGYVFEFDSPCNDILTYTCDGTQLFEDDGQFITKLLPILNKHGVTKWQRHPYTDVSVLKRRHPFSCINLPAGYFRMHSTFEYVSLVAVENSIALGEAAIRTLGNLCYTYSRDDRGKSPLHEVTLLQTHDV